MKASSDRCPWAIKFGVTLVTRCSLAGGHDGMHDGPGLAQFDYQRISWAAGDRREFRTGRDEAHAWEDAG